MLTGLDAGLHGADMDTRQWKAVKGLLDALDDVPEEERAARLDAMQIPDPEVRAEVASLLAAQQRQGAFLDAPPVLPPLEAGPAALESGAELGPFRIEGLIGRGGTAEVYRARRISDFDQVVAIKLLSERGEARIEYFQRERRIVAAMEHPGIARIIDGGIADGRPYMVMEYVEGADLLQHANDHRLDLNGRLELFRQVCDAVAFAHRHLVIHRDLKPSNIRVTPQGRVKLLDFGVAKLVRPDVRTDRFETATILTPEFAAPEQLYGEAVTTATDVYALGAVLFNLLVGAPPFDTRGQPLHMAIDLLLRSEAPAPSRAAARLPRAAVSPRLLRGDLDAIILRAMRRKPADRYASVAELWTDIMRFLAHQPVHARGGSTGYIAVRLLRRHRVGFAAATISLGAVLVGLSVALWQAREAQRAAEEARAQTERAVRARELLLSVFREQDPDARTGTSPPAPAEVIARGLAAVDEQLSDDPKLRALLLPDIGQLQIAFGDVTGGRATLERAERDRAAVFGADSLERVETLRQLVEAITNSALDDALRYGEQAQEILARIGQQDHVEAAYIDVALAPVMVGRPDGALWLERLAGARLAIERIYGSHSLRGAQAVTVEAQAYEQVRDDARALAAAEEAVARYERLQGVSGAGLVRPLRVIGYVRKRQGDLEGAAQAFMRQAEIARVHFGDRNNERLASALIELSALRQLQGRFDAAAELLQQSESAAPASANNTLGAMLKRRGELELRRGRPQAAVAAFESALQKERERLGDDHGYTWFVAARLGDALAATGQIERAEALQREALARVASIMGPDAYQNALLLDALARTLAQAGRPEEAARTQQRAIELTMKSYDASHNIMLERRREQARYLAAARDPALRGEAVGILDDAIRRMRTRDTPADPLLLAALLHARAQVLIALARTPAARADLVEALALLGDQMAPADAADIRALLESLATVPSDRADVTRTGAAAIGAAR